MTDPLMYASLSLHAGSNSLLFIFLFFPPLPLCILCGAAPHDVSFREGVLFHGEAPYNLFQQIKSVAGKKRNNKTINQKPTECVSGGTRRQRV